MFEFYLGPFLIFLCLHYFIFYGVLISLELALFQTFKVKIGYVTMNLLQLNSMALVYYKIILEQ